MEQAISATKKWIEEDLEARFLRYVKIHSSSDHESDTTPSTPQQWDMARLLERELAEMGVPEVQVTEYCNVYAKIPANDGGKRSALLFCSHMDTSPDFNGKDVSPQIHRNYDGSNIQLGPEHNLSPEDNPLLEKYVGETIITTDGSSLLGADDKAGIAEIMCALRFLTENPDYKHGDIEVVFTPDEEIGRGTDRFPDNLVSAKFGYTLDGDVEGTYNARCFNAWSVAIDFTGIMIHPGSARGQLVNAITMASAYLANVPRNESPETTDGEEGFYTAKKIVGDMESARLEFLVRDFEMDGMKRRLVYLEQLAELIEAQFPGGRVEFHATQSYLNLGQYLDKFPETTAVLEDAIRASGIEPVQKSIRGGTDGARLTENGIPTPNIFAGGLNFHSRYEWVALPAMVRATQVILHIVQLWK